MRPDVIVEEFLFGAVHSDPWIVISNFEAVCWISGVKVINSLNTWSVHNNFSNVNEVKEVDAGPAEEVFKNDLWPTEVGTPNLSEEHLNIVLILLERSFQNSL